MQRRLIAILVGLAMALGLAATVVAQPAMEPQVHAATGLSFPAEVAGIRLTRSNDYGKSAGQPGLGFSYQYSIPGRLLATVYVYNLDQRIPAGADNAVVAAQFRQAEGDIERVAQGGRYRNLQKVSGPALCRYGAVTLHCVSFSAVLAASDRPVFTRLMVTGFREHFVKLRLDWSEGDVEGFVQALFDALFR